MWAEVAGIDSVMPDSYLQQVSFRDHMLRSAASQEQRGMRCGAASVHNEGGARSRA